MLWVMSTSSPPSLGAYCDVCFRRARSHALLFCRYVKGVSYHNVALGQGQDVIAMEALELGNKQGHWVLLNNVHLMPGWLVELEKKLDQFAAEGSHEKFRVLLTGEASNSIPIGILSRSIKVGALVLLLRLLPFFNALTALVLPCS